MKSAPQNSQFKGIFQDVSVTEVIQLQQLRAYAFIYTEISFSPDTIPLFLHTHTCIPPEISRKWIRIFRQMFLQFFLQPRAFLLTNSNFWRKALLLQTLEPRPSQTNSLRIETGHTNVSVTMHNTSTVTQHCWSTTPWLSVLQQFAVSSGSLSYSITSEDEPLKFAVLNSPTLWLHCT